MAFNREVIFGGFSLCVFSSCMHMLGSSVTSFSLLSDLVCVANVVVGVSNRVPRVVFRLISFCLFVLIVLSEVVFSPKIKLRKYNFVRISSFFFADSSSLAS